MKRLILAVLLMAAAITGANARNSAKEIYNRFSKCRGADATTVSPLLCKFAAMAAKHDEDYAESDADEKIAVDMLAGVKSLHVLDLSDCSEGDKAEFARCIAGIDTKGYELLLEAEDDGDNIKIYIKTNGDYIEGFLLCDLSDPSLVSITGRFKNSDIESLVACAESGD